MSAYRSYFGLDNGGKPDYFRENVYASRGYTYQKLHYDVVQMLNAPADPEINGLWSWNYEDSHYSIEHTKVYTGISTYHYDDPSYTVFSMQSSSEFEDYHSRFRAMVQNCAYNCVRLVKDRNWKHGIYEYVTSISEIENGDLLYVMPKHELLVYPLQMVRVLDARFYWILGHIQNEPWNQIQFTEKDIPRITKVKREFAMIGEFYDT